MTESAWQQCLPEVSGPDPDDLPHAAAAIAGRADVLLTADKRGFDAGRLAEHRVRVVGADDFLCELLDRDREQVITRLRLLGTRTARRTARRIPGR